MSYTDTPGNGGCSSMVVEERIVVAIRWNSMSCDVPLGLNFNMVQVYVFLALMAQITGLKPGKAFHKLVNTHVYEDQLELFKGEMEREPTNAKPIFKINPKIKTLEDLETWVTLDDFELVGYEEEGVDFLAPIKYPFSV